MTVVDQKENKNDDSIKEKKSNGQESMPGPENPTMWGYDLYPERRGQKKSLSTVDYLTGKGNENMDKMKCERNVYQCIKTSPLVKLMMGALKSSGCSVDIRRHIACEECDTSVTGGYDPVLNQVNYCSCNYQVTVSR